MEIYYHEYDEHKAVRSVLTFSQFKKYVKKEEDLPSGGFLLRGEIPGITVAVSLFEKKSYPSFIFSVPIHRDYVPADIKENILLMDLYETYLRKVAWDDGN